MQLVNQNQGPQYIGASASYDRNETVNSIQQQQVIPFQQRLGLPPLQNLLYSTKPFIGPIQQLPSSFLPSQVLMPPVQYGGHMPQTMFLGGCDWMGVPAITAVPSILATDRMFTSPLGGIEAPGSPCLNTLSLSNATGNFHVSNGSIIGNPDIRGQRVGVAHGGRAIGRNSCEKDGLGGVTDQSKGYRYGNEVLFPETRVMSSGARNYTNISLSTGTEAVTGDITLSKAKKNRIISTVHSVEKSGVLKRLSASPPPRYVEGKHRHHEIISQDVKCHINATAINSGSDLDLSSPLMLGKDKQQRCDHLRSKFNSTGNLKRRVHTLLFWKIKLGAEFPVVDAMLRDSVWRNLDSCDYGIK